ncbi:MAG: hypothetical protein ABIG20_00095 [archaeon]
MTELGIIYNQHIQEKSAIWIAEQLKEDAELKDKITFLKVEHPTKEEIHKILDKEWKTKVPKIVDDYFDLLFKRYDTIPTPWADVYLFFARNPDLIGKNLKIISYKDAVKRYFEYAKEEDAETFENYLELSEDKKKIERYLKENKGRIILNFHNYDWMRHDDHGMELIDIPEKLYKLFWDRDDSIKYFSERMEVGGSQSPERYNMTYVEFREYNSNYRCSIEGDPNLRRFLRRPIARSYTDITNYKNIKPTKRTKEEFLPLIKKLCIFLMEGDYL